MSSDLDKAWQIVGEREVWVSERGAMRENIAIAVAKGIGVGRQDGLKLAAKLINEQICASSGKVDSE